MWDTKVLGRSVEIQKKEDRNFLNMISNAVFFIVEFFLQKPDKIQNKPCCVKQHATKELWWQTLN